ncbi:MAG: translation elongation factor 4 [Parcubacteria group bacterium]
MEQFNIKNFCIIAHIDAGKSTLADRFLELTNTLDKRVFKEQFLDSMELERERGITIKLQPVRMKYKLDGKEYILNLIDTPGHVDFSYEVSRSLAAVEGAVLLVDATKGVQAQTLANLHLAREQNLTIIPVINKIDLPNSRVDEVEEEIVNLLAVDRKDILKISAKTGEGVEEILKAIIKNVPSPGEKSENNFKALIFDSQFDTYKGVLAYVRVVEGSIKGGEEAILFASKKKFDVIEVGYFSPQLKKDEILESGQIGYIATGLKNLGQVRVGDTVVKSDASPLPGYKEPNPVVFASFYPEDGEQYDELRDALARLKITDASLTYEPESSPGLGRGFRLGFLGMLHTEIISERLRREFDLKLVISTPSVEYHVKTKTNKTLVVRSAAFLPDAGMIESIAEPVVNIELLSPVAYMGPIMTLMSEIRGQYIDTDYLSKEIVLLKYKVPLAEIVTDFYDKLKSISSGYASMNYEPAEYMVSDLVRLDVLVAGDLVEPFSRIIPRKSALYEGRRIVEKLKTVIPRQLFAVTLQAAIGGKIIAREDIKAMRKDVTGYLYGGDVTRKKKLLEKQKKGKAKMKERGKVNIPQEAFLEMLKK